MAQWKTSVERREKRLFPVLSRVTLTNRQDRAGFLSQPVHLQRRVPPYRAQLFVIFPLPL